jgi:hypothetical protein
MPASYTKREINDALKELHIKTIDGRVNAEEAARILSWRAKQERGIDHTYTPNAVRKHSGKLAPIHPYKEDGSANIRVNLYLTENVFELDIQPKRTNRGHRKMKEQGTEKVTHVTSLNHA